MKKIYKLLSLISITAFTTSTVVACGSIIPSKPNSSTPEENPNSGNESNNGNNESNVISPLIKSLKSEVNNAIQNNLTKTASNLYQLDALNSAEMSTLDNKFLKIDVLKKYKGKSITDPIELDEYQKSDLTNDTKKLLEFSTLISEIKKIYYKEEYKVLNYLDNINEVFDLKIDFGSIRIIFNQENLISANVLFNYSFDLNYKDAGNQKSTMNFNNNMIYGVTSDKDVSVAISKVLNELKSEGLLNNQTFKDSFAFDYQKFNIPQNNRVTYSDDTKYLVDLEKYVNTDDYKKNISSVLNNTYLSESKNKFSFVIDKNDFFGSYRNLQKLDSEKEYMSDSENKSNYPLVWKSKENYENKDYSSQNVYDLFFRENILKENDTVTLNNDGQQQVNKILLDVVKNSFKVNISNLYNKELTEIKSLNTKYSIDDLKSNSNLYNSIRLGYLTLKNLKIKIGEFEQLLPSFDVLCSYSPKESENVIPYNLANSEISDDFYKQSVLFASVYYNTRNGIKAMKRIFDFHEDTVNETYGHRTNGSRLDGKGLSLTTFSGNASKEIPSIRVNIWDTMVLPTSLYNPDLVSKNLSNSLSLKYDSQIQFSEYMKYIGNQDVFEWNFDFSNMYLEYSSSKGLSLVPNFFHMDGVTHYYGNLKLNFINIKFDIDENIYPNGTVAYWGMWWWRLNIIGRVS
ncbi:hypothetical protein [Spiroplasma turonicum]|uniref:Lipoprotein n=1 Tax=Spiroplasma turonicum TaxID=216946 RepID=A0A0K1P6Y1_9MOLU|nr:hypothetical protein [Spiroplasma turonicum]AKU79974.1 hypothetical protein STURON_00728 [Spiroplasma turonicum]ALX70980.1 hypothetical protein STURO_v1c07270 [Spiroplasma turonicum]